MCMRVPHQKTGFSTRRESFMEHWRTLFRIKLTRAYNDPLPAILSRAFLCKPVSVSLIILELQIPIQCTGIPSVPSFIKGPWFSSLYYIVFWHNWPFSERFKLIRGVCIHGAWHYIGLYQPHLLWVARVIQFPINTMRDCHNRL